MRINPKHKKPSVPSSPRLVPRGAKERLDMVAIGKTRYPFKDAYARLLAMSWLRLALSIVTLYFCINIVFTTFYLMIGDGIENARSSSFQDAFFFSVQTLATIGYGKMAPSGLAANIVVTFEALTGLCFIAVITGLVFTKFSRPTAQLLFSEVAVITPYNGIPHLMLRIANERGNRIVDANVHLTLLRLETSGEGHRMRRFQDLEMVRSRVPLLQLTWTIMHPIDEKSPLYGATQEKLKADEVEIIVSLTGIDETLSQTIHGRYSYLSHEVVCNAVFEDIIRRTDNGKVEINYSLFHKTRPQPEKTGI